MLNNNGKKQIIFNADDFGYTQGINRGILQAIDEGVVTSTSLMVKHVAALEARSMLRGRDDVSVGLHLDFNSEGFHGWLDIKNLIIKKPQIVMEMFNQQVNKFENIMGHLPHHIDSHFHVHRFTRLKPIVSEFSHKYHIPVRDVDANFRVGLYARSILKVGPRPNYLISLINRLPNGVSEIMCHPGYVDNALVSYGSRYLYQREKELTALIDPELIEWVNKLEDVELINWRAVSIN